MQLTVREIAGLLTVPEKTVYRWIAEEELPAYAVGDQYRANRTELLEWATSRQIPISAGLFARPCGPASLPDLSGALKTGGIFHGVEGADRAAVLGAIVRLMPLPSTVDRGVILQVLLARETLGSTAIGNGIALPHVRNPLIFPGLPASITLCFLKTPVDFGAPDGQPVSILFILVTPTARVHLHLLSRLSFTLRDPAFSELLRRPGSREEILQALQRSDTASPPLRPGTGPS